MFFSVFFSYMSIFVYGSKSVIFLNVEKVATVCHFLLFRGFTVLHASGPIKSKPHLCPSGDLQNEAQNHPFGSKNGVPFFIFFAKS